MRRTKICEEFSCGEEKEKGWRYCKKHLNLGSNSTQSKKKLREKFENQLNEISKKTGYSNTMFFRPNKLGLGKIKDTYGKPVKCSGALVDYVNYAKLLEKIASDMLLKKKEYLDHEKCWNVYTACKRNKSTNMCPYFRKWAEKTSDKRPFTYYIAPGAFKHKLFLEVYK